MPINASAVMLVPDPLHAVMFEVMFEIRYETFPTTDISHH